MMIQRQAMYMAVLQTAYLRFDLPRALPWAVAMPAFQADESVSKATACKAVIATAQGNALGKICHKNAACRAAISAGMRSGL